MAYFEFPHTRSYDGDLGYIIKKLNELSDKYGEFFALNMIKFADPAEWNITKIYEAYTIVINTSTDLAYISKKAVPVGVNISNTDYWEVICNLAIDSEARADIAELTSDITDANNAITDLSSALSSEITTRTSNDAILTGRLDSEIEDREASEAALSTAVSDANFAIGTESTQRQAADTVLSARIDAIEALPEGSTTGDAELIGIRTGADGRTYSTAGDAVRTQVLDIANLFDNVNMPYFYQGVIDVGDGDPVDAANRIRTTYIDHTITSKIYKVSAVSGCNIMVFVYDLDGSYLGALKSDGTYDTHPQWGTSRIIAGLNKNIIVAIKNQDESNITPDEFEKAIFTGYLTPDEKAHTDIATIADSIANPSAYIFFDSVNMDTSLYVGAIASDGQNAAGTYAKSSFRNRDYIPVNADCTHVHIVTKLETLTGYNPYIYINYYDTDLVFISRDGGLKKLDFVSEIPGTAKYFRVSFTTVRSNYADTNFLGAEIAQGIERNNVGSPVNKWYVLGDSISAGYFSMTEAQAAADGYTLVYKPSDYGYPVYGVGSAYLPDLSHNYWGYANKWFMHRDLQPNARPGQGYLKKASNDENGIDVIQRIDFSDAGLITVAWGFNDWHYDMERGDHTLIDPSVKYPSAGYDTTQITTVNQAIWFCLGELIRKAPQATIVVQLPMNGWLYGGDFDSNYAIGHSLTNAGTLAQIHDDIKYWADYYGLQIIDMTYNNSTINRLNINETLVDGSHPSDNAHKQLARYVGIALRYI